MKKHKNIFAKIYHITEKIPLGKVTTYGALAHALGNPRAARIVGWAMHSAPEGLPCHRVVNQRGELSGRTSFGDYHLQRDLLESEGVRFLPNDVVDMKAHFWNPKKKKWR